MVHGVDIRSPENITWCAVTGGITHLFWIDGYLLCLEIYPKSFEHEMAKGALPISHVCYAPFPKYTPVIEVKKGTEIPVVDASDMGIFPKLLKAILKPKGKARKKVH